MNGKMNGKVQPYLEGAGIFGNVKIRWLRYKDSIINAARYFSITLESLGKSQLKVGDAFIFF